MSEDGIDGSETSLSHARGVFVGVGEDPDEGRYDRFDVCGGVIEGEAEEAWVEEADGELVGGVADVFVYEGCYVPVSLSIA